MQGKEATNLRTEVIAGITTFFTMVYVVVVNPTILATPGTGLPFTGVMTATVALAIVMTLLMGLYGKLPFAVAPGMGINAFFTYTIILRNHVPWPTALGIVFWSGVIFLLCSVTPVRKHIVESIPHNMRLACGTGIGLFLAFIGFKQTGLVQADPATFVRLGTLDRFSVTTLLGMLIMVVLLRRKNPLAFLLGIAFITLAEYLGGRVTAPEQIVSMPDFSLFGALDIWGALQLALLPSILAIFFTDLFDSLSTFIGCSQAAGMTDAQGNPKNLRQGLIVDAWATLGGGLVGTSSGTAYIESSAGIEVGGRTGLTSVITALCFIPCLFLGPLAGMVPAHATGPVLILVGAMMFRSAQELELKKLEDLVPAFLTVILMPLTFSITQGILWGFISHVALFVAGGRRREVSPTLYGLALVSLGLLLIENIHVG